MKWHRLSKTGMVPLIMFGLLLSLSGFMGCETLDFSNPNSPDVSSATIQTLITGAEAEMREDLDVYIQAVSIIGREAYFFEPADPRFTTELLFGPIDPGGFLTTRPWFRRYQTIFNCNELLSRVPQLSGAEAAGVEAFARTIRAYQLLLVLNYMDTEGLRLNFDGDITKPLASKEEAFDFIEADLNAGFAALQNAGSSFTFKLSEGFAGFDTPEGFGKFNRALAARVAVYRMKFNEALSLLQQSFLDPNGDLDKGVYHVYSSALGDQLNPVFEVPTASVIKLHAHPSFEADAEPGDLRFARKIFKRSTVDVNDDLRSDLAIILHFGPGDPSSSSPYPIIRNEELILLRAEANIGLGNLEDARADINIIRRAAGVPEITAPFPSADAALDQLLHEKRYSLFMEGHRWVDMRRYNKFDELPIDRPDRGDRIIPHMEIPEDEIPD